MDIHLGVMVRILMPMKRFFQSGNGTQEAQVTVLKKGTHRRLNKAWNQQPFFL